MNDFNEYIRQNATRFDSEEPAEGHFERFERKLGRLNKLQTGWILIRIAAVIILAAVLSFFAFREFQKFDNRLRDEAMARSNPEFHEAEMYYQSQLEKYYRKIETLGFNNDKAEKQKVLKDLSAMDDQEKSMMHDLRQYPNDERIMDAIIKFYQLKMETMDVIITRTQEKQNSIL